MKPVFVLLLLLISVASAQVDTIDIARDLELDRLTDGSSQYQVFVARADGSPRYVALWNRSVHREIRNGVKRLVIRQQWWTNDSVGRREVVSICDPTTFSPVYHFAKSGNGKVEAFDFLGDRVVGSDSVAENSRKGFSVPAPMPFLNWELDMEVFQVLPYGVGKEFVIAFYHPGGPPPSYYRYVVAGHETLSLAGGGEVECWLLTFEFRGSSTTFWVSKETREVIKSMDQFPGGYRYKIKLATPMKPRM